MSLNMQHHTTLMEVPTETHTGLLEVPRKNHTALLDVPTEHDTDLLKIPKEHRTALLEVPTEHDTTLLELPREHHTGLLKVPREHRTAFLEVPTESPPNSSDTPPTVQESSGRSSSIGIVSSCGETIIGSDWLEEIDLALKELIIEENKGTTKKEKIAAEDIEIRKISLTEEEEKQIYKRVKSQLAHEYKKMFLEAHERNKAVKKEFRVFLENARDALLKAKVKAEQQKTKDEMRAIEEKQAEILKKRSRLKSRKLPQTKAGHASLCSKEHEKDRAMEMGHLRKIQSELDRVRARAQRQKRSAMRAKQRDHQRKDALLHQQLTRLERDREFHSLIIEIYDHGLHEEARTLTNALSVKEDKERTIQEYMKARKASAKKRALERLRKERLEEKARKERERIERERLEKIRQEEEKRKQLMMLLRRRAYNLELQSWAMTSKLNTRLSKAFTFSYFELDEN